MNTPVNICDNEPRENEYPCVEAGTENSCDVSDNNIVDSLILKLQTDFEQWTKLRVDTICKLRDIADFIGMFVWHILQTLSKNDVEGSSFFPIIHLQLPF